MGQVIYKYQLKGNKTILSIPVGSEVLTVQVDQKDQSLQLWMIVDVEKPNENRYFQIYGTGQTLRDAKYGGRKYVGTFQMNNGEYVGHLFEEEVST